MAPRSPLRLPRLALIALAAAVPCGFLSSFNAASAEPASPSPKLGISLEDDGATVTIDGKVFTRYLLRSGSRPALWPIIGPTGRPVTRSYPVGGPGEGEELDHPHHRSAWFGYEGVNGYDFWQGLEPGVDRPYPAGTIRHREFLRADTDGRTAIIATRNDWLNPDGAAVCHDERLLEFGVDGDSRWIDFRISLWSSAGPLNIIDTKEGCFALRVASTMRVDAGKGGRIVTSRGKENVDAWGTQAEWCDYIGPVNGETVGIAILSHPSSFVPLPRWHTRPYGLHAANPFGVAPFLEGNPALAPEADKKTGGLTAAEGEPISLRYRIYIHRGDEKAGDVAGAYAKFAKSK